MLSHTHYWLATCALRNSTILTFNFRDRFQSQNVWPKKNQSTGHLHLQHWKNVLQNVLKCIEGLENTVGLQADEIAQLKEIKKEQAKELSEEKETIEEQSIVIKVSLTFKNLVLSDAVHQTRFWWVQRKSVPKWKQMSPLFRILFFFSWSFCQKQSKTKRPKNLKRASVVNAESSSDCFSFSSYLCFSSLLCRCFWKLWKILSKDMLLRGQKNWQFQVWKSKVDL